MTGTVLQLLAAYTNHVSYFRSDSILIQNQIWLSHSVVQTCRIVFPRHWIHCSGTFLPFVNQWVSRFYLTQPTKTQTPSLQHQTPHQSVNQKEKPPVQPEVLWPHLLWKCTQRLTVGLLVAGTGSGATKLLGLAASGVGNQQGPVVLDQDVLDLLLGGLVHIWRTQEEVSMEDNGRNLTRVTAVRTEPYGLSSEPPQKDLLRTGRWWNKVPALKTSALESEKSFMKETFFFWYGWEVRLAVENWQGDLKTILS